MAYADMVAEVREALGVSESFDAVVIPDAIRAAAQWLLRGYNFPRNIYKDDAASGLPALTTSIVLPDLMKKEELVQIVDRSTPAAPTFKNLQKADGFRFPAADGMPSYYWLAGDGLMLDTPLPVAGLGVEIWFQTLDVDVAEPWLSTLFREELLHRAVYSKASFMRKPEVMQAFAPLWQESQTALAKYLNELEFDGQVLIMNEAQPTRGERYPRT